MRHACPASWPDKTIWAAFYYGFVTNNQGNVMFVTVGARSSCVGTAAPRLSFERSSNLILTFVG
jgi:hypothetical protein